MKLKVIIGLIFLGITHFFNAQSYLGLKEGNYIGALGMDMQPASIADSRYLVDVNLLGFDLSLYNSYLGWDSGFSNLQDAISNFEFTENERESHSLFLRSDVNLFSFMVSPNDKIAFGLSNRFRMYTNVDGLSNEFAKLMYNNVDVPSLWGKDILNDRLDIQSMMWVEYGLNYAQVLYNEGDHYVKVGAKVKLLQGLGAAYMYASDFDYSFLNADTIAIYDVDVSYGHSENINVLNENTFGYNFESKAGIGFDFGAVYEWRPDSYKTENEKRLKFFETVPTKYKLRAGLSVLDLGSIRYKKGGYSRNFKADIAYWNVRDIGVNNVQDWDTLMNHLFVSSIGNEDYFRMNLPTSINLNLDYNIYKTFFLNFNTQLAYQFKRNDSKSHDITAITISPRWEHKYFGVTLPITYSFLDGMRTGMALRLGPLYVGSSNLGSLVRTTNSKGVDFYFGARVPILKRVKKNKNGDSSF